MNHEIHETHEKVETLAEIVAEMRALAESAEAWQDGVAAATVARLANRIKAASRREVDKLNSVIQAQRSAFDAEQDRQRRAAPGDAAAMREVVTALAAVILPPWEKAGEDGWLDWVRAMQEKARAALAAPPRNCDRFVTLREARDAWFAAEVSPRLADKPMDHDEIPFPDWLFATVNEREVKV